MEQPTIREKLIEDILSEMSFAQALYFTWTGRKPNTAQNELLEAIFIVLLDHGSEALSTKTARLAASGGAAFHAALAAGLIAAGKHHGSIPLQEAMRLFQTAVREKTPADQLVADVLSAGKRFPGYGHRVYETDPRTMLLLKKAEALGMWDNHVEFALSVEQELEKQKGKKLCLNVDGMVGALLPGLGLSAEIAPAVFLVARSIGMAMHIANEQKEKPASLREA